MIRVIGISVEFGGKHLFDNVTFQVVKGEKIGLTGKNGAGKSTLLKMLAGVNNPQSGKIETSTGYTIGYLPQDINIVSELSVINETRKAFSEVETLEKDIEEIQNQLVSRTDYESDDYMKLINQLSEKETILANIGSQNVEESIERVLKGLGFESHEMDTPVSTLSGGWKMRIELAKILLQKPELVLLDEPTNHLDIESIIWLEQFLKEYEGSVMLVSHDKAFLDNITNRTVEIVMGKMEDYKCNYSNYLLQRVDRIEKQRQAKKNQDDFIKQTQDNIEKFRAKKNKAKFAQTLIKKLEKLERIEVDETDNTKMNIRFSTPPRSGKVVIKSESASKSFGEKDVLKNISFEINRGEKIAFVGKNGMGKTTLSKMIIGEHDYTGDIELGHNVELAYFGQHQADLMDGNRTVFETIDDIATGNMRTQVRSLLGSFLFSGEDVDKKVKVLSGGERTRLALAKLLLEPANLLVLDEPTNHLDLVSKDMLKQAIKNYEGTVIVVSHDRDFLQGLTEKVFEFKDKKVKEHVGDINEFLRLRDAANFRQFELNKEKQKAAQKIVEKSKPSVSKQPKASNKELHEWRKDFRRVENKINKLETTLAEIDGKLKDADEYQKLTAEADFFKKYEQMKNDLDHNMEQWEILGQKIEENS
ncbi:MAG: ABC-F family ATP-binding cassette domain-containing protein [Chitinophagales bacterium]